VFVHHQDHLKKTKTPLKLLERYQYLIDFKVKIRQFIVYSQKTHSGFQEYIQ